jgi:hypothetical protein
MSQLLNQAFGLELAAARQAQYQAEAQRGALIRMLKRTRRADHALTARAAQTAKAAKAAQSATRRPSPVAQPAGACCRADLG